MKSRQLEKVFQTKVLKILRKLPHSYWIKINDRVTVGLPDIVGVIRGHYVAIELKTQSKLTKLQAHTLKQMQNAGARAHVMTPSNSLEIIAELEQLAGRDLKTPLSVAPLPERASAPAHKRHPLAD